MRDLSSTESVEEGLKVLGIHGEHINEVIPATDRKACMKSCARLFLLGLVY